MKMVVGVAVARAATAGGAVMTYALMSGRRRPRQRFRPAAHASVTATDAVVVAVAGCPRRHLLHRGGVEGGLSDVAAEHGRSLRRR